MGLNGVGHIEGPLGDVVTIAAVIVAVGIIWRTCVGPVVRAAKLLSEAVPTLLSVARDFQPDHGNSLHDRIVRTDERMDRVEQHVTDHTRTLERQDDRLDAIEDRLHEITDVEHRVATRLNVRSRTERTRRTDPKPKGKT